MARGTHAGGGMGQGTARGGGRAGVAAKTAWVDALPAVALLSGGTVIGGEAAHCVIRVMHRAAL